MHPILMNVLGFGIEKVILVVLTALIYLVIVADTKEQPPQ